MEIHKSSPILSNNSSSSALCGSVLLKILNLNVHEWKSKTYTQGNFLPILNLLKQLDVDIIFLEEVAYPELILPSFDLCNDPKYVNQEKLEILSQELKMEIVHDKYQCGLTNAILSKFPMQEKWRKQIKIKQREGRNVVGARLKGQHD